MRRWIAVVALASATAASPVAAQTADLDDVEEVRAVVEAYFDGMMMRDRSTLERAFHPDARLIGAPAGIVRTIPFEEWATNTAKGEPRVEGYDNRIVTIDVTGNTAMAKVDLEWPNQHYVDYLTLLEVDDEWKIVNKVWFEEPSAAKRVGIADLPVEESRRRALTGRYELDQGIIEIVEVADGLAARYSGSPAVRLLHQGDGVFAWASDTAVRLAFRTEGDRAVAVEITTASGERATAQRIDEG